MGLQTRYDFFVSYSSSDRQFVASMIACLSAKGIKCWSDWARLRLTAHSDWPEQITAGVNSSSRFVLVLSEASSMSEEVRKELSFATGPKPPKPVYVVNLCDETGERAPSGPLTFQLGDRQQMLANRSRPDLAADALQFAFLHDVIRDPRLTAGEGAAGGAHVKRADLVNDVKLRFEHERWPKPAAVILWGPGGSGKSTLADDVCDETRRAVMRMMAGTNLTRRAAEPDTLFFIDGYPNDRFADSPQMMDWLRSIGAHDILLTCRTTYARNRIRRAIGESHKIHEVEVGGLTREEFCDAAQKCLCGNGYGQPVSMRGELLDNLFALTGGVPLFLSLLGQLADDAATADFQFLATATPEKRLALLCEEWRRTLCQAAADTIDARLEQALFVLANVPVTGMNLDAIAWILESPAGMDDALRKLWALGFVQRVVDSDAALRCHDCIRSAFVANNAEASRVGILRRRFESYYRTVSRGDKPLTSMITFMDSMQRASESIFEHVTQGRHGEEDSEYGRLAFHNFDSLQQLVLSGDRDVAPYAERFCGWLCEHVKRELVGMKCSYAIPMARLAQSLPCAEPRLGEAFCTAWEQSGCDDCLVLVESLLASIRHWEYQIRADPLVYRDRVTSALARLHWHKHTGFGDLVAAGFAAALAAMGLHSLAAAFLTGYQVRGRDLSMCEGFSVLLLSLDARRDSQTMEAFGVHYGHWCTLEPIVWTYLRERGVCARQAEQGHLIQANFNRVYTLGSWARNGEFCDYVRELSRRANTVPNQERIMEIRRTDVVEVAHRFQRGLS